MNYEQDDYEQDDPDDVGSYPWPTDVWFAISNKPYSTDTGTKRIAAITWNLI